MAGSFPYTHVQIQGYKDAARAEDSKRFDLTTDRSRDMPEMVKFSTDGFECYFEIEELRRAVDRISGE